MSKQIVCVGHCRYPDSINNCVKDLAKGRKILSVNTQTEYPERMFPPWINVTILVEEPFRSRIRTNDNKRKRNPNFRF